MPWLFAQAMKTWLVNKASTSEYSALWRTRIHAMLGVR